MKCKELKSDWDITDEEKRIVDNWIRCNIDRRTNINNHDSSYKLKHYFSHSDEGFYITEMNFTIAMVRRGFKYKRHDNRYWFNVSKKSPCFYSGLSCY